MKQVNGKELAAAVTRKGWRLVRIKGSHHVFMMEGRRERIVIPVHGTGNIAGTLGSRNIGVSPRFNS